jgi:putative oxygen-independent coproporphyrinogen III oxidase
MYQEGQIGIYFHWPFCLSKCPYCDFNVYVRDRGDLDADHERWLAAYLTSLEYYAQLMPDRTVASVFFGGGTPSLMAPETVARVLDKIHALWPCANDIEITLEANPTSVEADKFTAFRDAGINRVSIGVQALNNADLKFLGRTHDQGQALGAIEVASKTFERFSFDLIYARPQQSLKAWEAELAQAIDLAGGHLSLYQLTIERNTPFYYDHEQGKFSIPEQDLAADFYALTQDVLGAAGLPAYEVSNHAADGHESVHNLIYWRYGDYIGIGPGAHGRLTLADGRKCATREHQVPDIWMERVEENGTGVHPLEGLDHQGRFMEALMMGLRVPEGLPFARLNAQCEEGKDARDYLDMTKLDMLAGQGWLSYDEERLVLSVEGMLRLNAIVPYILK